ncbi:MAG TPA: hypothetical protein VFS40_06145 [Gemmatimonadales bacterium]|nr:hypothetical protein [Gemmatimonadales bacterium]
MPFPPRLLLAYAMIILAGIILGIELMTLLSAVGLRAGASEAIGNAAGDARLAAAPVHALWVALAAALGWAGWRLLRQTPRP